MPHFKKLCGELCYLSPVSMDDAEAWTRWDNNLEVSIPLGDEAYTPLSFEKAQEQIQNVIQSQANIFSIVDLETDRLIGRGMLFDIDRVNRCAMLGLVIGEQEYWGRGYGQEATRLLLDYGFHLLNLNNIMLGVYAYNQRGLHTYQRVGFHEIGRRRQARILNGKAFDLVLMDILAEEFPWTSIPGMPGTKGRI